MPSLQDVLVGKLALRRELISGATLMQCVAEQRDGSTLGQVLVRRQLITPANLVELIQTAERTELACPRCGQSTTAAGVDAQGGLRCPRCGSTLTILLEGEELSDRFTTGRTGKHRTEALVPVPGQYTPTPTRPDTPQVSVGNQTVTGSRRFAAPGRSFSGSFGGYEILEELGRGGMGVVYKARQPRLDRFVALKILLAGELASQNQVKRFQREAEIASRLKHPGIVQIHDVGQIGEYHYFTMDYVDGEPLSALIKGRRLGIRRAVEIARDVARALEHAHQRGAVHRDIKPANVLVDRDGLAVLTDFGLARDLGADEDQRLTKTGAVVGTPYYMSPEQARGARDLIGAKSDVYSLGVVLFESLTFSLPFKAETQLELTTLILTQDPPHPTTIEPAIDRDVETIVLKAMAKEPDERYATAGEMADDLDRYLRNEAILARPPGGLARLARAARRHHLLLAGTGLGLIFLAGGYVALSAWVESVRPPEPPPTPPPPPPPPPPSQAAAARLALERAALEAARSPDGESYRRGLERVVQLATEALGLAENAQDAALMVQRGLAYERLRKKPDAAADYRRAAEVDRRGPAGAEGAYLLARLRLREVEDGEPSAEALEELARAARERSDPAAGAWGEILRASVALMRDKDPQAGLSALMRAKSLDERVAELHTLEGMTRAQLNDQEEATRAERALTRARSIDDKDAVVWFYLGRLHAALGSLTQAQDDLDRALDLDPQLGAARLFRAQLRRQAGRPQEAMADLRLLLEQRPEDADLIKLMARMLQVDGKEGEAEVLLTRLEKIAPADPTPHLARSGAAFQAGNGRMGLEHVLRAFRRAPPGSELRERLLNRANNLADSVDGGAEALEAHARELRGVQRDDVDADLLEIHAALIQARKDAERGQPAVRAALEAALAAHPRDRRLRAGELFVAYHLKDRELEPLAGKFEADFGSDPRGLAYLARFRALVGEDLPAAERLLRRALQLDERCADALGLMAFLAMSSKPPRFEDARRLALGAIEASALPEGEWLNLLGIATAELDQPEQAVAALQEAMAADPFDHRSPDTIAKILIERKRVREALDFLRTYSRFMTQLHQPIHPAIGALMADAHARQGEFEQAIPILEELVRLYPEELALGLQLAETCAAGGDLGRARAAVAAVLAKEPRHPRALELREKLGP